MWTQPLANRLISYELFLFRRSFGDAFGRTRDRILLGAIVCLAVFWLAEAAMAQAETALPPRAMLFAGAAAPLGFTWQRMLAGRLSRLAENSILAAEAIDPRIGRRYVAFGHLPILLLLILGVLALGDATERLAATAGIGMAAWAAGIAAASWPKVPRPLLRAAAPTRSNGVSAASHASTAVEAIVRHQLFGLPQPVWTGLSLVAVTVLLATAGAALAAESPAAVRVAATSLPSLALLALTSRNDARLVGYLCFTGHSAFRVAAAMCTIPVISFGALAAALSIAAITDRAMITGLLLLLHCGAWLILVARAWLSPGRGDRSVNLQIQLELVILGVIGLLLPPLAPIAFGSRMWMLHRRYTSSMWMQL